MRVRRFWRALALVVILGALTVAGIAWKLHSDRQAEALVREALDDARRDRDAGRTSSAAGRLAALDQAHPGRDDITLERALTELARDRAGPALDHLNRISPVSSLYPRAAAARGQLEIEHGQFAQAEATLSAALASAPVGADRRGLRDALVRLLRSEGRTDEARQLYLDGAGDWSDPLAFLKGLYRLDVEPFPIEGVRVYLQRSADAAPDDDRVWLGRARLALREGHLDYARTWLDACRARRPDDAATWSAQLDWSRLADRLDTAREALGHVAWNQRAEHEWRVWLAHRAGDPVRELAELESWSRSEPGAVEPLARLVDIALAGNDPGRAREYRARQAAIHRDRDRLRALMTDPNPRPHAAEIAQLCSRLGQNYEARAWAALARGEPLPPAPTVATRLTLADRLGTVLTTARESESPSRAVGSAITPRFENDAEKAGLSFLHESGSNGDRQKLIPPTTSSGGVGLIDYDGDGWLDVYCVQGGPFPPDPRTPGPGDRLYRNRGDGTFEDVTEGSRLASFARGYGHGVAVGDVDNDGCPDLFVTRWGAYALYRNRGDGTFEDVTKRWGLDGDRDWPTSAAFADLDGDGDLDLYVCHYFRWNTQQPSACYDPKNPAVYRCSPRDFPALPDHLFRNDGDRFTDVSAAAGITAGDSDGRGFGVVAVDLDEDGRLDLFVTNDMSANFYWRNQGGLHFEEVAHEAGLAGNVSGDYQAGMGVACDDFDGDGRPDLAVTNFYGESSTYFHNLGHGHFADQSQALGLTAPTRFLLGFGITFLDADNDGQLDLLTANGHITDGRPQFPWRMPLQLLQGQNGQVRDVSARAGAALALGHIGRALAAVDLDHDGRVDALVIAQDEPMIYLHNATEPRGYSLTLALESRAPGTNRDAIGAVVTVTSRERRGTGRRIGGGSYQTAPDPRLRFGLAGSARAEKVEVRWPSGKTQTFTHLSAGGYRLVEGEPNARPLPGFELRDSQRSTPDRASAHRLPSPLSTRTLERQATP